MQNEKLVFGAVAEVFHMPSRAEVCRVAGCCGQPAAIAYEYSQSPRTGKKRRLSATGLCKFHANDPVVLKKLPNAELQWLLFNDTAMSRAIEERERSRAGS